MEMQYFVRPGTQAEHFNFWKRERMQWHRDLGIPQERLRYKDHDKLAHYADAATDIEFFYPFGWKETEGIHSRTDYDLRRHQEFSGKKQTYFDPETQESYIPYVIETSVGLDRTVLMHLCNAYCEAEAPTADGGTEMRTTLKFHPSIAPTTVAVLPLVKKEGMSEAARSIHEKLKTRFFAAYDEKDAIGRRYRRQDAKGTPFCVTVDSDTAADGTVTVRERDSMRQERVSIDALESYLSDKISGALEG
jgi:glycyl-tRNA synthetase